MTATESTLESPIDAREAELQRAVFRLRLDFGWSASVRDGLLTVELDEELGAVELTEHHAAAVLARLREHELDCPVVLLPAGGDGRCVLFFRPGAAEVPGSLDAGHAVVLPPSAVLHGESQWLSSPWQRTASLPTPDLLARLLEETARPVVPAPRRVA